MRAITMRPRSSIVKLFEERLKGYDQRIVEFARADQRESWWIMIRECGSA
jgi:hypothetical protein